MSVAVSSPAFGIVALPEGVKHLAKLHNISRVQLSNALELCHGLGSFCLDLFRWVSQLSLALLLLSRYTCMRRTRRRWRTRTSSTRSSYFSRTPTTRDLFPPLSMVRFLHLLQEPLAHLGSHVAKQYINSGVVTWPISSSYFLPRKKSRYALHVSVAILDHNASRVRSHNALRHLTSCFAISIEPRYRWRTKGGLIQNFSSFWKWYSWEAYQKKLGSQAQFIHAGDSEKCPRPWRGWLIFKQPADSKGWRISHVIPSRTESPPFGWGEQWVCVV